MKILHDLRIEEQNASLLFEPDEGKRLGGILIDGVLVGAVRKIVIPHDDPRIPRIRELQKRMRFCYSPGTQYLYEKQELDSGELLLLNIDAFFSPNGEECGTNYDDSKACPICGGGLQQVGPLRLRPSSIPKKELIASTRNAQEVIFAERFVDTLLDFGATGAQYSRVVASRTTVVPWFQPLFTSKVSVQPPTVVGRELFNDDSERYENRCPAGI